MWKSFSIESEERGHKLYIIVTCYGCGKPLPAKAGQKTKQCPYCRTTLSLDKAKKVASAKTAREASRTVRRMKEKATEER